MPLLDITNPKVINFLLENYEKENLMRLSWIRKHKEKIYEAATLHREAKNYYVENVLASTMKVGMTATTRDFIASGYNRKKVPMRDGVMTLGIGKIRHDHSITSLGLGDPKIDPRLVRPDTDLSLDPIMKPVDSEIKKIVHKSKPEFGREVYLRRRAKDLPEKKYYFQECSNWDYGWRLQDAKTQQGPEFGRCWHLARCLKNRAGAQKDPDHYREPEIPGPAKCVKI